MVMTRSSKDHYQTSVSGDNENRNDVKSEVEDGEQATQSLRFAPLKDGEGGSSFKTNLQRFQYAQDGKAEKISPLKPIDGISLVKNSRKRPPTDPTTSAPSPSPAKRRRTTSKYAPPSKYAHLPQLTDILAPDLLTVFVGTNPGIRTATAGHAYAHPSNLFWKLLHSSGCTDTRLPPSSDVDLPRLYAMGNTNIVERPSRDAAELSKAEMAAGTPVLDAKVAEWKPESVCIVGKGIWQAVWRYRYGREMKKEEFKWGWQDDRERMGRVEEGEDGEGWEGARVYVTTSTSGSAASLKPAEKEAIWAPFGEWVKRKRKDRFGTEGRIEAVAEAVDPRAAA